MFLLSTTEIHLKGEKILKVYREKDVVEKASERLNPRSR